MNPPQPDREPRRRAWREHATSAATTIAVVLLFRAFVAEAVVIPSGSMAPTLEVGDRLFVNKLVYGLKVPGALAKLPGRSPRRGEVAVFVDPRDPTKDDLIKRIIGIGGDRVEMRANVLHINGRAVPRQPLELPCARAFDDDGTVEPCAQYEEMLDGQRYRVLQRTSSPPHSFTPRLVPAGHVFVLGDSRDNSNDSRYWGTVPYSHLKGRAMFFIWSSGGPAQRERGIIVRPVH
jgi:signal peptidase I